MTHTFGSRTSGVDGSSEGGRTNTINLPGTLMLYGVELIRHLHQGGASTKLSVAPVQVDGIWCLELSYTGEPPAGAPDHWHGHRVMLRRPDPPAA